MAGGESAQADFLEWAERLERQLTVVERRLTLERRRGDLLQIQNDLLRHRLMQQGQHGNVFQPPGKEEPEPSALRRRLDQLEAAWREAERRAEALEAQTRVGLLPPPRSWPAPDEPSVQDDELLRRLAELEATRREAEPRAEALERDCARLEALDSHRLQAERRAAELERRLDELDGALPLADGPAGSQAWSVGDSFRLCGAEETADFSERVVFVSKSLASTVADAVERLNGRREPAMECKEKWLAVFSEDKDAWFVLHRRGLGEEARARVLHGSSGADDPSNGRR